MRSIMLSRSGWPVPTLVCAALLLLPREAHAYVGPGVGLTVIGVVLAFLGAVFFAIFGFVWYPLKRLYAAVRRRFTRDGDADESAVS